MKANPPEAFSSRFLGSQRGAGVGEASQAHSSHLTPCLPPRFLPADFPVTTGALFTFPLWKTF